MLAHLLIPIVLFSTQTESDPAAERVDALLERGATACYAVASDRRDVPVRESYIALSPVLDRLSKGRVFIGERVPGENKVLVYSPHVRGAVGLARYTFTRQVASSYCRKPTRLYAPTAETVKGWGRALDGKAAIPSAPGSYSSTGCYVRKNDATPFWGTRDVSETGRYARRVTHLNTDGSRSVSYPLWSVKRLPRHDCAGASAG